MACRNETLGVQVQLVLRCAALRFSTDANTPAEELLLLQYLSTLWISIASLVSPLDAAIITVYLVLPVLSPLIVTFTCYPLHPARSPSGQTFLPPSPRAIVTSHEFMSFNLNWHYHHTCLIKPFRSLRRQNTTCKVLRSRTHSIAVTKRKRSNSE